MTLGMGNLGCLVDEKGQIAVVDEHGKIVRGVRRIRQEGQGRGGGGKIGNAVKMDGGAVVAVKVDDDARVKTGHVAKPSALVELDWKTLWNEGTDAVMDVPLGGVCEILYGEDRDSEDSDDLDDYYD